MDAFTRFDLEARRALERALDRATELGHSEVLVTHLEFAFAEALTIGGPRTETGSREVVLSASIKRVVAIAQEMAVRQGLPVTPEVLRAAVEVEKARRPTNP